MLFSQSVLGRSAVPVLSKALDAYALRGKAMANNIANVSTPDYKRIEVSFENSLQDALHKTRLTGERTDKGHMYLGRDDLKNVKVDAHRIEDMTNPGEINNVDIDLENAKMAENSIAFNFGVRFIKDQMSSISSAIKGSGLGQ
jgi:flagellar basal-body rod protein FlgB